MVAAFKEAAVKLDAHAFSMVFHEDADFTNVWGMRSRGRRPIEDFHRPLLRATVCRGLRFSSTPYSRFWTRTSLRAS